ncbi:hypothetical protein LCA30_09950 [Vibrio harveyi]|uniref:hypothetical protein n=1 Tax=Vibrio harveyi TaxID=669 RepID=UPI003BB5BFCB
MTKIPNDLNKVLYRSYSTCSNLKKTHKNTNKRGMVNSIFELCDFFLNAKKYKSDVVFFTYGVNRVEKNGISFNKFSDSLSSLNPSLKYINFEDEKISRSFCKDYGVVNRNISFLDFSSKIISRLFNIKIGKLDANSYEEYLSKFGKKNKAQYILYYFSIKAILKVVQPKIVFVTNWYSIRSMSIISVAHDLGITVVDIQHGLSAANNHRCYINLSCINENILPNYFFCWSKKDKCVIDEQFESDRAIETGRVWRFLPKEAIALPFEKVKPIVLLICGLDLPSWFSKLEEKVQNKYDFLIRPHPTFGLSQESIAFLNKVNNVYIHEHGSLEDVLDYAACCLGEWSAGLVEAQENGTVTIAYGAEACKYFQNSKILCTDDFDSLVNYLLNYGKYTDLQELNVTKYEDNISRFISEKFNAEQ